MTAPAWIARALATVEVADSAGERSLASVEIDALAQALAEHLPIDEMALYLSQSELGSVVRTLTAVEGEPLVFADLHGLVSGLLAETSEDITLAEGIRRLATQRDSARDEARRLESGLGTAEYVSAKIAEARDQLADQVTDAHRALDAAIAPPIVEGRTLEIAERIRLLCRRCLDLENDQRLSLSNAEARIARACDRLSVQISPTHHVGALDLALDMVDQAFLDLRTSVSESRAEADRHRAAAEAMRSVGREFAEQAEQRAVRREGVIRGLQSEIKGLKRALSATESERNLAVRAKTRGLKRLLGTDRQRAAASTMRDQATSQLAILRTQASEALSRASEASRKADRLSRRLAEEMRRGDHLRKREADLLFERDDARSLADALEVDLAALEEAVRELCDED